MRSFRQNQAFLHTCAALLLALACGTASAQESPREISIQPRSDGVAINAPGGQVPDPRIMRLTNPSRLVLDFPGVSLSADSYRLRTQLASLGVRTAVHPDENMTRVVFDLPAGDNLWISPTGKELVVLRRQEREPLAARSPAVAGSRTSLPVASRARTASVAPPVARTRITPQPLRQARIVEQQASQSRLFVAFSNGLLTVSARDVTFGEVLSRIAAECGAGLDLGSPMNMRDRVALEVGPLPTVDVLKALFSGSQYNYILITSPNNKDHIDRILVPSLLQTVPVPTVTMADTTPPPVQDIEAQPQLPATAILPTVDPRYQLDESRRAEDDRPH